MALFRKSRVDQPSTRLGPAPGRPLGRKFHSDASTQTCIDNFKAVVVDCYPVAGGDPFFTPEWDPNAGPAPTALLGVRFDQSNQAAYLAIWEGAYLEIDFVPPQYTGAPIPLPGAWKMLDGSLTSIGETTRFGVR